MLKDCEAKIRVKALLLFTDTGITVACLQSGFGGDNNITCCCQHQQHMGFNVLLEINKWHDQHYFSVALMSCPGVVGE